MKETGSSGISPAFRHPENRNVPAPIPWIPDANVGSFEKKS
jgi:hypothetical protein